MNYIITGGTVFIGTHLTKKDGVVDNLDMESIECAIVAYTDGAEGHVTECCFRGLKLRGQGCRLYL